MKDEGSADHVKILEKVYNERIADEKITFEPACIESYSDIYQRSLKLAN